MAHKNLTPEDRRAAHRRGHSVNLTERVLEDRGPRIPRGGVVGQSVVKTSFQDDEIGWGAGGGGGGALPNGGTTGQALVKNSNADGDASWATVAGPAGPAGPPGSTGATGVGVPAGGTTGQFLAKIDNTDYNTQWVTGGGGGDPRLWDVDYVWVPPHQYLSSTSFTTTGGTAYFVYLGKTKTAINVTQIGWYIQTANTFPYFEVALLTSATAPDRAIKTLTCIASDTALLHTDTGDKLHSITASVPADTHVWYGFRTFTPPDSGGGSSGVVRGIVGDFGRGSILTTTGLGGVGGGAEHFAAGNLYTGQPNTIPPGSPAAPYAYVVLS